MPTPTNSETRSEFIGRCIPMMVHEGKEQDQAVAMCNSIWREHNKGDKQMKKMLNSIDIEVKEVDDANRTITTIGSKETIDRDGDIVKLDNLDLKGYKKNPVVLWSHNHHELPIGKAVGKKVWIEGNNLMFKVQFATAEENPKADAVYRLYKGGFLKAFSISFRPDFSTITYKENSEGRNIRTIHDAELFELSAVSIPANQSALIQSFGKALDAEVIDSKELEELTDMCGSAQKLDTLCEKDIDIEVMKLKLTQATDTIEELVEALESKEEERTIFDEIFDEFRISADESSADENQTKPSELNIDDVI